MSIYEHCCDMPDKKKRATNEDHTSFKAAENCERNLHSVM
jgi:hypothetical protein